MYGNRSYPTCKMDETGVMETEFGFGFIPWEGIRTAKVKTTPFGVFLCLEIIDEYRYVNRLSHRTQVANAHLNMPTFTFRIYADQAGILIDPNYFEALVSLEGGILSTYRTLSLTFSISCGAKQNWDILFTIASPIDRRGIADPFGSDICGAGGFIDA